MSVAASAPNDAPVSAGVFIDFPEQLPVSGRRAEIEAALRAHQVVIVCGETGSGKTTQLPKIALAMGRGRLNAAPGQKGRLIGHTQPRRLAATSVAKRIAEELRTPLGEVVGYKIRFGDRLSAGASVKLMTDGILLAETQSDPLLKAYDTLIIDEAHERSLNIDFLLGYVKQILPRRPDLKLIVTSATIDADRFAQHFADAQGRPAPVLMVSGRTYPVEQRWRPFEESRDYGLNEAIADAVDELWVGQRLAPGRAPLGGSADVQRAAWGPVSGDILVFLPGEREIREAADHLRQHLARHPVTRHAEVLPLFARLSQAEQDRVFATGGAPRIVLATNVAETSLTVPGIRFVIDSGTARVKRYSLRSKVEQLLIEPISQAAANQRAGRCGRVADGVCIRLYDEQDFAGRPCFSDPEILRSSLAAVILRMKALRLLEGDARVEDFPFLDAPSGRAIADGFQLLAELGAVDEAQQLTDLGRELARLPLDPRVARMIVEASARDALAEVLVIAAALSVQDVRDRPLEQQAQADQQHAKFDDEKSEFSGYVRLWKWLHDARGGQVVKTRAQMAASEGRGTRKPVNLAALPVAQRAALAMDAARQALGASAIVPSPQTSSRGRRGKTGQERSQAREGEAQQPAHKLSNRQWENLLRQNFINVRRVREWRDTHTQLLTVVRERRWTPNTQPAGYEAVHKSLLAGLLGNVGCKIETEGDPRQSSGDYLGARGIKFHRHPGVHLSRRPGKWVVCAELVQTTRLFGRGIATIEPQWLEELGAHLLKRQLLEPHWEQKAADVVALERATLYGLVVYGGRRKSFGTVDPVTAREIFIRQALVAGQWNTRWPFLAANFKTIAKVQEIEHKSRRQDVLVDEELIYAFYDQHLPENVYNGASFDRWYRTVSKDQPELLRLSRDELMRHEAAGITTDKFPKMVRLGGVDCAASYLHEPGHPRDGLTVNVPLFVLNQVSEERCEWLVPGMLKDKIQALLRSLPQRPRSRFVPLPRHAERLTALFLQDEHWAQGNLVDALLAQARSETRLDIKRSDFRPDMLSPHLLMNIRVLDEHGRQLGQGRNLAALKAEWGGQARGAFQALAGLKLATAAAEQATPEPSPPGGGQGGGRAQTPAPVQPAPGGAQTSTCAADAGAMPADQRHTSWDFGELPELLEIRQGKQSLIGFPALIDHGDAVGIEVFDEPELAAARHRLGLRRLFALQVRDALKYLDKNIPDLQAMAVTYMPLGTQDELRQHIIDLALERAFMAEPLPATADSFAQRVQEGRTRLTLIANEVARLAGTILQEWSAAQRKLRDSRQLPEAARADITRQLQNLLPRNFLLRTPWTQLQHLPRYLKAVGMRLDKQRGDPQRDADRQQELRALETRYWRLLAERKGQQDARLDEYRWMLEELRVSFFAQQLRTPYPVSVKRLDRFWGQLL